MIGLDYGFELARRTAGTSLLVGLALAATSRSDAQTYSLVSGNSSAQVNVSTAGPTLAGLSGWQVSGVNQLNQQWFYYRLGSGGLPFSGAALPIESLSLGAPTSVVQSDPSSLAVTYANANLSVQVSYSLLGSAMGSANSRLIENITFQNLSANTTYLQLLDYADFNLTGKTGGQSGQFYANAAGNTYFQTLGSAALTNRATANLLLGGHMSHVQASLLSDGTLANLLNGSLVALNDQASAGVGDVTSAGEWDVVLAPNGQLGSSFNVSETLSLTSVPEPAGTALLGLGLVVLARLGRVAARNKP